jgi:hypothetical protein
MWYQKILTEVSSLIWYIFTTSIVKLVKPSATFQGGNNLS